MLICIYCVIFITWIRVSFCIKRFKNNKKNLKKKYIAPHLLTILNTSSTVFSSTEEQFTDQSSEPLEIEDSLNLILIIG